MENCSESLVFLGSHSYQLAQEMVRLGKFFDLPDQRDHILVVSNTTAASANSIKDKKNNLPIDSFELSPCIHKSHTVCTLCSEALHELENAYRVMMEKGNPSRETYFFSDLGSYKDTWRYLMSNDIASEFCKSQKSIFLLPPNPIAGFDIFCSLYSISQAIQSNSPLIIRSMRESLSSDENIDTHFPKSATLSDSLERIAADFLVPMYTPWHFSNDLPMLWPYNVCSCNHRVFDIRSSLYYSLKQIRKRQSTTNLKSTVHKSTNEQLPYRVVASSIHHLNNYYRSSDLFDSSFINTKSSDHSLLLDYRECKVNAQFGVAEFSSSLSKSTAEIKSVMGHATPGLDWLIVNDLFKTSESTVAATSTRSSSASSSQVKDVAIATFQSEFGEMETRRITESARRMLKVGAYGRYFTEEFSRETIMDCLMIIDDYFDL